MRHKLIAVVALAAGSAVALLAQNRRPATVQEQIDRLNQRVDDLATRVAALEDAGPPDDGEAAAVAEVQKAFRRGHIAVGMTLAQVNQLAGSRGKMEAQRDSTTFYVWTISTTKQLIPDNKPTPLGQYVLEVAFRDGKVASFSRR